MKTKMRLLELDMQFRAEMRSLILLSRYLEFCSQNSQGETRKKAKSATRLSKASETFYDVSGFEHHNI